MGSLIKVYGVFAYGNIEREEMKAVNSAIFDVIEYVDPMEKLDDILIYLEPEEITCEEPESISSFAYSFIHLSELWYLYMCSVSLGAIVRGFHKFMEFYKEKKGKFLFLGIRAERNK